MYYNPEYRNAIEYVLATQERYERETDLQQEIYHYISRFNEDELTLVLKYAKNVYLASDAYRLDKAAWEAKHGKAAAV